MVIYLTYNHKSRGLWENIEHEPEVRRGSKSTSGGDLDSERLDAYTADKSNYSMKGMNRVMTIDGRVCGYGFKICKQQSVQREDTERVTGV